MDQLKSKGKIISITVKIALVVIVIGIALYVLYFKSVQGRAIFILSDREIELPADTQGKSEFNPNSRVYFFVARNYSNLDGSMMALEIESMKDSNYVHHKRISFEIEKGFKKLHTFIPEEYFSRSGKYRIKLFIDNNLMTSKTFSVGE